MKKIIDEESTISTDSPLADPAQDRLGYAPFAKHLAESILKIGATNGLVIGLFGPWGSGKTTASNFIASYLQERKNPPIIIKFNPWWFSGDEDLIRSFFRELRSAFDKNELQDEDLLNEIVEFGEGITGAANVVDTSGILGFSIKWLFQKIKPKKLDVPDLKNTISSKLAKFEKKTLIIIDDIDRLTAEEIRQIFKLVKAVADFPNVVYLLSFDKNVVIKALESVQHGSGESYLEKIVQVPFELPVPDKQILRKLLFEKLNIILRDIDDKDFDSQRWQNVFFDGIDKFISTPRNIVRLFNTLAVTYAAVAGEVNIVDFVAIESIRVFSPTTYEVIRSNQNQFTGTIGRTAFSDDRELNELKNFHNSWIATLPDNEKEIIKPFLALLFPKLNKIWGNIHSGGDSDELDWRRLARVCSPDVFPIYFRLVISGDTISPTTIKSIVDITNNQKAFEKRLIDFSQDKLSDGTSRARVLLERLRDYTFKEIPKENIPVIIKSFFNVGDQLLIAEDKTGDFLDFDNEVLIGRLIWPLFKRQTKEENFEILKGAIRTGMAISTITSKVAILGQQHGKLGADNPEPEEQRFLTPQQLSEVESLVVRKIHRFVKDGSLLESKRLANILYRWKDWTKNPNEVKSWVRKITRSDKNLAIFISSFLSKTQIYGSGGTRTKYRLDPKALESLINVDGLVERAQKILENKNLKEESRIAFQTLIREYDLRKQGKDPNNPFAHLDD